MTAKVSLNQIEMEIQNMILQHNIDRPAALECIREILDQEKDAIEFYDKELVIEYLDPNRVIH